MLASSRLSQTSSSSDDKPRSKRKDRPETLSSPSTSQLEVELNVAPVAKKQKSEVTLESLAETVEKQRLEIESLKNGHSEYVKALTLKPSDLKKLEEKVDANLTNVRSEADKYFKSYDRQLDQLVVAGKAEVKNIIESVRAAVNPRLSSTVDSITATNTRVLELQQHMIHMQRENTAKNADFELLVTYIVNMHYWLLNNSAGMHYPIPSLPQLQTCAIQPTLYQENMPTAAEAQLPSYAAPVQSPPASTPPGFYMHQNSSSVYPAHSAATIYPLFNISFNQTTSIPVQSSSGQPYPGAAPYRHF